MSRRLILAALVAGLVLPVLGNGGISAALAFERVRWPDGRILRPAAVVPADSPSAPAGAVVRFPPGERLARVGDSVFVSRRVRDSRARGRDAIVFCRPALFDYCGRF